MLITFSVLKKCKIKFALHQLTRTITISSDAMKPTFDFNKMQVICRDWTYSRDFARVTENRTCLKAMKFPICSQNKLDKAPSYTTCSVKICTIDSKISLDKHKPEWPRITLHNVFRYSDANFVDVLPSWRPEEEPELRVEVLRNMKILPDFVTEAEEASLLAEVEPQLKRMRYEFDHWDNAIEGYRETERSSWREENEAVLARVRAVFPQNSSLLPHMHVLDLAAAGHIKPHVDAVRFCGDVIAGLCLLSSAVMRLAHEQWPHLALDALLQRRCLYVMSGVARYRFTHAVLGGDSSSWRGERLPRRRRVALIARERPRASAERPAPL